jgi:hypothetical protein
MHDKSREGNLQDCFRELIQHHGTAKMKRRNHEDGIHNPSV